VPKVVSLPDTIDALKLAKQQLRWVDEHQDIVARSYIYLLLYVYLIVLVAYSVFLVVAIGLTAARIWTIPWSTLTSMGAGNFGLGASSYFFRAPMNHLFHGH
jgi:hypothetical protein